MEGLTPANSADGTPAAPRRRKGPPGWGIAVFLLLLVASVLVTHFASQSGPPIQWIDGDLDQALAQARDGPGRVFLYLYDPNDPVHARNESELFNKYWVRESLANVVCCRVKLDSPEHWLLAQRYRYDRTPLMLLLDRAGKVQGRVDGIAVDDRQFDTFIGRPARRAGERASEQAGEHAGEPAAQETQ